MKAQTSAVIPEGRFPQRLAELGFEAHRDANGVEFITPPLCMVAAGPFLMGSDPEKDSDDSPRLKPGASGMTLVCRPTPIVRFHPVERALLTDSTIGWHRFKDGDAVTRRNALRRNR